MNINVYTNIDLNELIWTIMNKVLQFNNIKLSNEEIEKMVNYITNDTDVINAMKNIGK